MTVGAITGAGLLAMLPSAPVEPRDDSRPPLFTILEGNGGRQLPCKQQLWVNSDRACQTWTVPHSNVERILLEKTDAIGTAAATAPAEIADMPMPAPQSDTPPVPPVVAAFGQVMRPIKAHHDESPRGRAAEPAAAADIISGETVAEVRTRAVPVLEDKAKVARRSTDAPRNIPVASHSADGTPRVIMIRPTSRQDVLYYSARRERVAASSPAASR
jgi:hypothetical protein